MGSPERRPERIGHRHVTAPVPQILAMGEVDLAKGLDSRRVLVCLVPPDQVELARLDDEAIRPREGT